MKKVAFGRTGLQVSPLGYGSAPIGYLQTDQDRVARILHFLLDNGVNLIDTAASYLASEEVIGNAIGHRRSEYVLVSKCGTRVDEIDEPAWSAPLITQTVDRALRRLKTEVLDVMLLHSCDLPTLKRGDALGALVKARDAGKVRFIGYSGDNDALTYAAGLPDVSVVEMSVNLVDQFNIDEGLPVCRKHHLGVIAKRPIANAAWQGAENRPGFYGSYVEPYVGRLQRMGISPTDVGLPATGAGWLEMAIRFTLSIPGVHTAIVGTTNPDNAEQNIAAAEKGPLSSEDVERIREAFGTVSAGEWFGQT